MADLHVVALITSKPGSESIVQAALEELAGSTRSEAGCLSYDVYASAVVPSVFVTVERWRGQADLDGHMASPHLAKTFEVAGQHLASEPVIHTLDPIDVA